MSELRMEITEKSACQLLELISLVDRPKLFAEQLEKNAMNEIRETDNDALKKFLLEPHIMVSGYDPEVLFYQDSYKDVITPRIESLKNLGVHIKGDGKAFRKSLEAMNKGLKLKLSGDRVKRYIIPAMMLIKLSLKFDVPDLAAQKSKDMQKTNAAKSQGNILTDLIFSSQLYVLDREKTQISGANNNAQASYTNLVYLSTLTALASSLEKKSLMRLEDFLFCQMFQELGLPPGLCSPSSIEKLLNDVRDRRLANDINEAFIMDMLKFLLESSFLICVHLLKSLEKYIPKLISERKKSQWVLSDEEREKAHLFDEKMIILKKELPLSIGPIKGATVRSESNTFMKTSSTAVDMTVAKKYKDGEFPSMLANTFMRPDLVVSMRLSEESRRFNLWSIELKANEFWSSSDSGDIMDYFCMDPSTTETGSKRFLECLRQMELSTMLARARTGILTNGSTSIHLRFKPESVFVTIPESDRKHKIQKTSDDIFASESRHEDIFRIQNTYLELFERNSNTRGRSSGASSHLAFFIGAKLKDLLPLAINLELSGFPSEPHKDQKVDVKDFEEKLVLIENSNDDFMSRSFNFIIKRSASSIMWIALYKCQGELFSALSYKLDETAKKQLEDVQKRLDGYLEQKKSKRLAAKVEKESSGYINLITSPEKQDSIKSSLLDKLTHVREILQLMRESPKDFGCKGLDQSGGSSGKIGEKNETYDLYDCPSTANEFRALISGLKPPAEIVIFDEMFQVKHLLKGARIPRCHDRGDGISVVLVVEEKAVANKDDP